MAAHGPPALRGRAGERALLDRLLDEPARRAERGPGHPRRGGRRQDGAAAVRRARGRGLSASRGSPASSPRWSCPSRGCISSARRCSSRLDALPEPQQDALRRRARARPPAMRPTASWSPWPRSRCSRRWRRSGRCCASSMTRSGSTAPRPRSSGSSRGGCWRSRWRSCSPSVTRPSERELAGLPELRLGGLDDEDARALLATVIPGRLDERVRDRIVAETRGNPAGAAGAPARALDRAAGRRVRAARARCRCRAGSRRASCGGSRSCRRETQLLLLVAAAEPRRRPGADVAAPRRGSGSPAWPLEPAARAGMLEIGAQVRFRHPLVRSARLSVGVGRRAPDACTGALAEATDASVEPDRRAWHRAQATRGPDEEVAAELERSAGRAQARGGLAAAAAFLGRAADLTADPARRAERMLAAAQANLQAGAFDAALALLAARPGGAAGRARARAGGSAAGRGRLRAEPRRRRSRRCCSGPRARSSRSTLRLCARHLSRRVGRSAVRRAAGERRRPARGLPGGARAAPRPRTRPRPCDLLLDGFALVFTEGRAAAAPVLQRAAAGFAGERGLRRGGAAVGLAGDGGGRATCGTSTPASRSPTAGSSSRATRGRSRCSPSASTCSARRVALCGDFARGGAADRRGGRGHGGDGHARRPVRRARARGAPRPGGRGRPS